MDKVLIQNRINELKHQYSLAQERLEKLQQQESELRSTILRIYNAINVLEEVLKEQD
ncbi:hypothetical protein [Taibaiella lutea]|uniref:hypothetical protein n=1 Tax=Taibaiella lutea TaxID=2608001 RepID=UPI00167FE226|nr:hypothetical protein [Taibaiella lutea]